MNKAQQDALASVLEATLEDGRLARGEEGDLRATVAAIAGERESLAFVRNRAFKLASARITQAPRDTLAWLERVDKIVDNAARPARPAADPRCGFSPGDECLHMIRREIAGTRRSLDVCVFTITDNRLTDALFDADRRGVALRVVTDNDKQYDAGSDVQRLAESGIPTRFDPDRDHMHHKFALVDGVRLLTGSYNWTRGATRNHENVLIVEHPATVRRYAAEFERLWQAFDPASTS